MDQEERVVPEDARVIVGAAVALWGSAVAGAGIAGLFEKLPLEETAIIVSFVTIFALATYLLDSSVRGFVDGLRHRIAIAIALDLGVALAWTYPPALAFILPLAAVATAAALARHEPPAITSSAAKSPGARPAAT